jgi:predicted metal-dependent hydrolase
VRDNAFVRGARLFDAGAFFDAHEEWEARWLIEKDETNRRVLQGLIQIAAAFHKLIVIGSADSASRLLAKGLAKIDESRDAVDAMSLDSFREGVHACARDLAHGSFDRSAIPKLDFDRDPDLDLAPK